jgi:hypothetical protein
MKYLKMLGLAAVAAMALMAVVGASTASATELYQVTPGGVKDTLGYGTTLHATLEPGTSAALTDTAGNPIDTCTTSTVHGTIGVEDAGGVKTGVGSSTTTTVGKIGSLTWGASGDPCTAEVTNTTVKGELEIHHIAGTDNGTVTGKGNVVTIKIFGISCLYGTGAGTTLGTLTGKTSATEHATMDINAVINEQEPKQFICPDTGRWIGSYVVTSPTAVYVQAS